MRNMGSQSGLVTPFHGYTFDPDNQQKKPMLKFRSLLSIAVLFLLLTAEAKNKSDFNADVHMLEVSGILTIDGVRATDYMVYIFEDGALNDSFYITNRFEQYFGLELGHDYALKFKKAGYKERVMLIDTHLPEDAQSGYYIFRYEIEFIKKDQSNTFDDFPVCFVTYDGKKKDFDYNRTYHFNVRYNSGAPAGQTVSQNSTAELSKQ